MRIAWEEPFGPVIPVIRVKNIDDAIDHCNSNNLALQVYRYLSICCLWSELAALLCGSTQFFNSPSEEDSVA